MRAKRGMSSSFQSRRINRDVSIYTGLHQITFDVDFAPGIEIGWRLAHEYWGHGYAPEAATACLEYTRKQPDITELYSFTSLPNLRSERVMQKIGMTRMKEFDHPKEQSQ